MMSKLKAGTNESLLTDLMCITKSKFIKMINNEYLTVKEVSKEFKVSGRYIRKIIEGMNKETNNNLLYKDLTNRWQIHRLILAKFKPKRTKAPKYYALSIDPVSNFSESEIDEIMKFVYDNMRDDNIEINYTIEKKKANGRNHLHCYINCKQKRKLIKNIRLGFSTVSYREQDIYDFEGWRNYITKDGATIKTIKN